jgi:hypothetical protein
MSGHFVCYRPIKFRAETLKTIEVVNEVIEEYESQGIPMSLRQVYYQMVARGHIENSEKSYDRLGAVVGDGRMAGLVSWTAIEDRGRGLEGHRTYRTVEGAVSLLSKQYKIDLWEDQPFYPEVWVEKAAQEGTVGAICDKLRVNYFACKGYNSLSEQWRAGRRMAAHASRGQRPIVFHLGDHDPSGIDMTRDNQERLSLFAGAKVQVVRLALNMPQVEELRPPPNPTKFQDSRAADYIKKYGHESWEMDALEPRYIMNLISDAVARIRDEAVWSKAELLEQQDQAEIAALVEGEGDEDE